MNQKLSLLPVLIAALLAAVCFSQWRSNEQLRKQVVSLQQSLAESEERYEADQQELQRLEQEKRELDRQRGSLTDELQNLRSGQAQPAPALGGPVSSEASSSLGVAPQEQGFGGFVSRMLSDPSMKGVMRQQQALIMDTMYGGLFKELGLTSEETEKFKALLLDRQMHAVETGSALFKGSNDGADTAAVAGDLAASEKNLENELKSFLGEERYARYKAYSDTMAERMTLNQFSQQMAASQTPLNTEQTDQLLQILSEEKKGDAGGYGKLAPDGSGNLTNWQAMLSEKKLEEFFRGQEEVNQRVFERAKAVLNAEQLDAFAAHQSSQLQMQRAGMIMATKMFGTRKSSPATQPEVRP